MSKMKTMLEDLMDLTKEFEVTMNMRQREAEEISKDCGYKECYDMITELDDKQLERTACVMLDHINDMKKPLSRMVTLITLFKGTKREILFKLVQSTLEGILMIAKKEVEEDAERTERGEDRKEQ